jgi:hypothetical protein
MEIIWENIFTSTGIIDCDTLICPDHTFKCVVDQTSDSQSVTTQRKCYDDRNMVILDKSEVTQLTRTQSVNSEVVASIDKNGVVNSSQSSVSGQQFQTYHQPYQPYQPLDRYENSLILRQSLLKRIHKIHRRVKALRQKLAPATFSMSSYLRALLQDN